MKKIGILHGKERSFPEAFVSRINSKNVEGIHAEPVYIEKVVQGESSGYAVIIDRISQDIPFYRAYLKNAALCGTAVINNPFWWSADEKFFNNCLSTKINVPVPKTVILPSKDLPVDTTGESFSNLSYPLDWAGIFNYIGFPAYMKPFAGGGWKNVYRVTSIDDFFPDHLVLPLYLQYSWWGPIWPECDGSLPLYRLHPTLQILKSKEFARCISHVGLRASGPANALIRRNTVHR